MKLWLKSYSTTLKSKSPKKQGNLSCHKWPLPFHGAGQQQSGFGAGPNKPKPHVAVRLLGPEACNRGNSCGSSMRIFPREEEMKWSIENSRKSQKSQGPSAWQGPLMHEFTEEYSGSKSFLVGIIGNISSEPQISSNSRLTTSEVRDTYTVDLDATRPRCDSTRVTDTFDGVS
ncbi:hypothetical protein ARMGADRAFT_1038477 [Armillaria gallica]|uniref:Uncharacterized protein n=1 Tax=Armillaria gallica TaxID=47427 RepID=A0A2H3CU49_ARMGA|nr:hypothetical protein ARMGADRAFT_1038477 [Armillaria gallica]